MFCTAVAAEPADQRDELDLLGAEGVGLAADEGDQPDRGRPDEQRRGQPRAKPELEQHRFLGMELVEHVAPVDGAPRRERLEDRAVDRARASRREDFSGALARGREHFELVAFDEHDGDPIERHEPAHLADERAERLLEDQGRPERAGAAIRGLEHVDTATERIPQLLGLGRAALRHRALAFEAQHEPADDQTDDDLASDLERDVVGVELLTGVPARRCSNSISTGMVKTVSTSGPTIPKRTAASTMARYRTWRIGLPLSKL